MSSAPEGLPPRPAGKILKAEQAAAWIDGFAFLDTARTAAEQAETQAEQARAQARQAGYQAGLQEGRAEAATLVAQTQEQLRAYIDSLDTVIADLAMDIVRRVLGEFDETALVARCVANALSDVRHDMPLTIRVAPNQVEPLEQALNALAPAVRQRIDAVEADAQLSATQCLLVSAAAVVDIGLESQLDTLREALQQRAPETSP